MKKLLSAVLSIALCLCSFAAVAEEGQIPEVEVVLDETYVQVDLEEGFAYTMLPADWAVLETEMEVAEGNELLCAYASADQTMTMVAMYSESEEPTTYEAGLESLIAQGVQATRIIVNGYEYLCAMVQGETMSQVSFISLLDEEGTAAITLVFTYANDASAQMDAISQQAVAGLGFYEAEE